MLRGADVPTMMMRVEGALAKAERTRAGAGPVFVYSEGDAELGIAQLRGPAKIEVEFFSGSGRPVVGRMVRFAKRVIRRSLRWYVGPVAEQQTRMNHAVLDLIERLRVQNEQLLTEMELLQVRTDKELRALGAEIDELRARLSRGEG